MISGNMVGMYSTIGKTLLFVDESGNEVTGVVTENMQMFDATPADVRINKTFVSDNGIGIGENTITYRTSEGSEYILPGLKFCVSDLGTYNEYNYTKLQCIIAKYSSNQNERASAEKIVLNDSVYNVGSSVVLSTVTKNADDKSIDLNIVNNTEDIYIIYFFTYAQEES